MGLRRSEPALVYFVRPIGAAGPVKIGCTTRPMKRLHELMHWSPAPLELAAAFAGTVVDEERLHAHFADLRSHAEWFRADPRIDAVIEDIRAGTFSLDKLTDLKRAA